MTPAPRTGGLDPGTLDAVVFDYGSTLIEFAPTELARCDTAMAEAVTARFGPHDPGRFRQLRAADRARPFLGDPPSYLETPLEMLARGLVQALYDTEPSNDDVIAISSARRDTFVAIVTKPDYLDTLLTALKDRYALGVLSNYPDGEAIRGSMDRLGIGRHFEAVAVSGDIGVVKPHPRAFSTICKQLDVAPERALYVGDNWLADVQGAKRAGMRAVLTTQFQTPEPPERREGDVEPDAIVGHLTELAPLLLGGAGGG